MNNSVVEVRGVRIGEGAPKIIIPITSSTRDHILSDAQKAVDRYSPDIIEWRADWYYDASNANSMIRIAGEIGDVVGNMPILFTLRTAEEGGEVMLRPNSYLDLNLHIAASGKIDMVDIELFKAEVAGAESIIRKIQRCGVKVIISNHDFDGTPDKVELVSRLCAMRSLGADICKIAVMPRRRADVFALIEATCEFRERYRDRPVIAISMSDMGLITRLCGGLYGSAATFGTAGNASAPGQIDAAKLKNIVDCIFDTTGE